eukprot:scaffold63451_cov63-Phaeocystis_antarctica.AAC.5
MASPGASRGRCGQAHHVREEVDLHGEGQLVGSRHHTDRGGRARRAGPSTQSQSRARELRVCLALLVCHQRLLSGVRLGTIQRAARRVASEGLDCCLPRPLDLRRAAAANVGAACLAQLRPRRLRLPVVLPLCFVVSARTANHV